MLIRYRLNHLIRSRLLFVDPSGLERLRARRHEKSFGWVDTVELNLSGYYNPEKRSFEFLDSLSVVWTDEGFPTVIVPNHYTKEQQERIKETPEDVPKGVNRLVVGLFARGGLGDGDEVVDLGCGGLGGVVLHEHLLWEGENLVKRRQSAL